MHSTVVGSKNVFLFFVCCAEKAGHCLLYAVLCAVVLWCCGAAVRCGAQACASTNLPAISGCRLTVQPSDKEHCGDGGAFAGNVVVVVVVVVAGGKSVANQRQIGIRCAYGLRAGGCE